MSTTEITTTKPQDTTYNGWANKATWLVNVYLYDYLYSSAVELIETYGIQHTSAERMHYVVSELIGDTVRELLYDAIEQIDNGRDSMLRAMVCDFVSISVYDVDTYALATHIVEQYLEERE